MTARELPRAPDLPGGARPGAFARVRMRIFGGLEAVLFLLVVVLLGLIVLQVFTRYVMHASLPWTEEVARMVLVWAVMIGAAIAMDRNEHYAVLFLFDRLTGASRLWVLVLINLLGLAFLTVLAWHGSRYVATSLNTVYVSTQVARGWINLALPVGAGLMGFSLVMHTLEAYHAYHRGRVSNSEAPEAKEPGP